MNSTRAVQDSYEQMADREDTLLDNRATKIERIRANGLDP